MLRLRAFGLSAVLLVLSGARSPLVGGTPPSQPAYLLEQKNRVILRNDDGQIFLQFCRGGTDLYV